MQSLYRYRQFNENTIREILKEELYFTSPLEFNDPFDSRPFIDTKASIEEYKKLYKEIMKVQQPSLADKDLDYILERDFDEDKIANQPELLKKSVTEWAIESSVCVLLF